MPFVGAWRNIDEAKAPVYLKANGLTIAYIAASCTEYTVYTPEATATSPGNFWFDDYDVVDTAVAEIRITGTCDDKGMRLPESEEVKLVIHPGMQSEVFTSWANTPEWRSDAFRRLEDISINVTIDDDGVVHGQ